MSMDDDIKALRDALAAGPTPGEWEDRSWNEDRRYSDQECADLAWTAAASPDRIARLLARLEEAEADAGRYRWLNGPDSEWEPFDSSWLSHVNLYGQMPADMDAYIDAAMQEAP